MFSLPPWLRRRLSLYSHAVGHINGSINIPAASSIKRRHNRGDEEDRLSPSPRLSRKGRRRSSTERHMDQVAEQLEAAERCMSHGRPRRQFASRMGTWVVIYTGTSEWRTNSKGEETCTNEWAVQLRRNLIFEGKVKIATFLRGGYEMFYVGYPFFCIDHRQSGGGGGGGGLMGSSSAEAPATIGARRRLSIPMAHLESPTVADGLLS